MVTTSQTLLTGYPVPGTYQLDGARRRRKRAWKPNVHAVGHHQRPIGGAAGGDAQTGMVRRATGAPQDCRGQLAEGMRRQVYALYVAVRINGGGSVSSTAQSWEGGRERKLFVGLHMLLLFYDLLRKSVPGAEYGSRRIRYVECR